MNCVGIDVSKGKSTIAVMRPFGEVVVSPFEVCHTASELSELARLLKSLDGETRVVMESTGNYHAPVAWLLHGAGLYVSVVNAMLVHDYGNNSLRRAKTDKKDAVKLANYGLDHWITLPRYVPEEDTRLMLKSCYRQYQQYSKSADHAEEQPDFLPGHRFPRRKPPVYQSAPRRRQREMGGLCSCFLALRVRLRPV